MQIKCPTDNFIIFANNKTNKLSRIFPVLHLVKSENITCLADRQAHTVANLWWNRNVKLNSKKILMQKKTSEGQGKNYMENRRKVRKFHQGGSFLGLNRQGLILIIN